MLWLALTVLPAFASDPITLDAGSLGGAVFEGFDRLSPDECPLVGCEWTRKTRGARHSTMPDPLVADWINGGVLHIDRPAGEYVGYAQIGVTNGHSGYYPDYAIGSRFGLRVDGQDLISEQVPSGRDYLSSFYHLGDPFPMFGEGLTEWDRTLAPQHTWRPFTFTMDEDGVDIEVFGTGLQALVIASAEDAIEAEVIVEAADSARRIWYHEQTWPQAAEWPAPDVGDGPLSVAFEHWREFPDSSAASTTPVLEMTAFRGARSGQIAWLFGSDDPVTYSVSGLDDLVIETGEVHWLDIRSDQELIRKPRPAFVRPTDGALRGEQGATVGLAFTVIVPEDAKPKHHHGTLTIERGGEQLDIPIDIDVSKLELADAPFPTGYFVDFRPVVSQLFGLESPESLAVFGEDVRLMRERGLDTIALRSAATWYPFIGDVPEEYGVGVMPQAAAMWREAGGDQVIWVDPFFAMTNRGAYREPQRIDRDLAQMLAQASVDNDVSIYLFDEGGNRSRSNNKLGRRLAEAFRQTGLPVRLAGALDNPIDWMYAGDYDIAMQTLHPAPSAGRSDLFRALGAEGWAYNMIPGRLAAYSAWAMDSDGLLTWHLNDVIGSEYTAIGGRADFARSYLSPDGTTVWPGTLLNGNGEGLLDVRVLHTLELAADAAEARGRDTTRARAILAASKESMLGQKTFGPYDNARMTEDQAHALRLAAAEEALRLQRGKRLKRRYEPVAGELTALVVPALWIKGPPPQYVIPPDAPYSEGPTPTADGSLDEPLWTQAPTGPALRPSTNARAATTGRISPVVTPDGMAFGMTDLPSETSGELLIDPDGLGQRWVTIDIPAADGPMMLTRCSWDGEAPPSDRYMSVGTTPCVPLGMSVGQRLGANAEVFVPWTAIPTRNADLGIAWKLRGPDGLDGTSVPTGGLRLLPGQGTHNLDTGTRRGSVRVVTDVLDNTWNVRASIESAAIDETWQWEVWHFGGMVAHGTHEVPANAQSTEFDIPALDLGQAWLTLRAPATDGQLPRTAQKLLPRPMFHFAPATPVATTEQELTYGLSNNIAGATVETLFEGRVIGTTTVDLRGGSNNLRLTGSTGDMIRVSLPDDDGGPSTVVTIPIVPRTP